MAVIPKITNEILFDLKYMCQLMLENISTGGSGSLRHLARLIGGDNQPAHGNNNRH